MPSLRRFGQAVGDAASTLGQGMEENDKLKMEYGYRNQLRGDQIAQHEADFQQRQGDIESQNKFRDTQAAQAQKDAEAQRAFEAQMKGFVPSAPVGPGGGTPNYRPQTSLENPNPYYNSATDAKDQADISSNVSKFIGNAGPNAGKITDTPAFKQLIANSSTRSQGLESQTALNAQNAASAENLKRTGDLADQKNLFSFEQSLRDQSDAKKEADRRLTAAAKSSDPMATRTALAALDASEKAWDKAFGANSDVKGPFGMPLMGPEHPYLRDLGELASGHMPGYEKTAANPNVASYQQTLETTPLALSKVYAPNSRGITASVPIRLSMPQPGDEYNQGKARFAEMHQQLRWGPQIAQLEDAEGALDDVGKYTSHWEGIVKKVKADQAQFGPKSAFAGKSSVIDPVTKIEIPIR